MDERMYVSARACLFCTTLTPFSYRVRNPRYPFDNLFTPTQMFYFALFISKKADERIPAGTDRTCGPLLHVFAHVTCTRTCGAVQSSEQRLRHIPTFCWVINPTRASWASWRILFLWILILSPQQTFSLSYCVYRNEWKREYWKYFFFVKHSCWWPRHVLNLFLSQQLPSLPTSQGRLGKCWWKKRGNLREIVVVVCV